MIARSEEAASLGWGVRVDVEAFAVNNDVVVVPAEDGEVVRVGAAAMAPGGDVVRLKAIPGGATVGSACPAVAMQDETAQLR